MKEIEVDGTGDFREIGLPENRGKGKGSMACEALWYKRALGKKFILKGM